MSDQVTSHRRPRAQRWLRSWAPSRWWVLVGTFLAMVAVLTLSSPLSPLGDRVGSWWVTSAVILVSASFAFGAASLAGARGARAATVCDLRPLIAAFVAGYIAVLPATGGSVATDLLVSLGPWGLAVGQPLLALVAVLAPLISIRDRMDAELAPASHGETCATCTPLPSLMGSHTD